MARLPLVRDRHGEIVDRRALREERGGARASAGRSILPSQPSRIPTPERLAAMLRRAETPGYGASVAYLELAELMEERHLHYLGVLGTRRRAVSQIGVAIEPASDSADDVRDADLVRGLFEREEFADEAFDILDAVGKGYSVTEIVWDMSERQWMPVRLQHQLPQWYDYDPDTGTRLMRREMAGYVELEPYKFVVHAAPAKSGLPGRSGLARCAAWAWMLGCYTLNDWMRFCEVYGQPLRIGRYHPGASDKDRRTLFRAVRDIATDAAAILPEGMTIDFEGGDSTAAHSEIYSDLLAYLDARISIAVLGQTLTTESGGTGSYALGQVHNLVRHDIERDDGRRLAATLRRDLVIPVVQLNHGPRPAYPRVTIERETAVDVDLMSKSLERLVPLGLRVRADEVRARLRLAPPDDDDEVLTAPAAPAAPPGAADPPEPAPARARDAGADLNDCRALARTLDEGDPLPTLTARTRAALGPLVDAWAGRVRDALDAADSLATVRTALDARLAWTVSPRAPVPDVADVAAALAPALMAAHLAGRYDVTEEAGGVALATAAALHTQLPFEEQIAFFRSKTNLGTEAWTDLWQEQHDRAFVVAGAAEADLVADLRGAVDRAIADGTTLATFRRDFDSIVARHGWSYNGGRDWRTRVIYGTNLRTSYAAGRYRQMKDVAEHRPYWRYRHSDASEQPRHDHLAWDGLILRHDDPWWDTHYPPNGWGCKCYIETLAERDMQRLGKDGPDTAPAVRTRTVTVGAKGPTPRTVTVPVGIDPGWAYAPGQSVARPPPGRRTDPFAIPELRRADATAHRVGPQAGSNPGGLYRGTDGRLRYVKLYDDAAQSYGEAVANRAYRELGLDAPVSALIRDGDAVVGVANEIIDHDGTLAALARARKGGLPKGRARKVLDGYAADAWLANWDALGLELDNVVATRAGRDAVARIDAGGALLMRARRGRKPAGALDRLSEWDGFSNPQRNPAYARVLRAAGVDSGDALGRRALRQIAAIDALGRRTRDFERLAPDVRGVAGADRDAIRRMLRTRARVLRDEIAPRVRRYLAEARLLPAYMRATRTEMGHLYTGYLSRGKRKVESGFDPHGMTDPELVVSYAYTTSDVPWGYARPNQALRRAARDGTPVPKRFDDYRLTLNDALDRLPDYPAVGLRRGAALSAEDVARYVPGRIVTEAGFTSASYGRGFGGNVQFVIRSRHGKRIDQLSAYPGEREVLFKAGTRFRVRDVRPEHGHTRIDLEEVDDA